MKMFAYIACGLLAAAPLFAWESSAAKALAGHWKKSKEYTMEMARLMPADAYGFKASPVEMSFGQQMAHIAQSEGFFLGTITGAKPDEAKPANYEKETVLKMLNDAFDNGQKAIEGMTDAQLTKSYELEGSSMAGVDVVNFALDHTTHHRGQCVVYLRLKGIKPAEYRY